MLEEERTLKRTQDEEWQESLNEDRRKRVKKNQQNSCTINGLVTVANEKTILFRLKGSLNKLKAFVQKGHISVF